MLQGPCSSEDSTTYGVNHDSCLNKIFHFNVASLQIPQDVMHVLLEGVLPLNVRLMLGSFINDGLFTIDELNDHVKSFEYGRVETKTKPKAI